MKQPLDWRIIYILGIVPSCFCQHLSVEKGRKALASQFITESGIDFPDVYIMEDRGDHARVPKTETEMDDIRYFCHSGTQPSLGRFWSSAAFKLDIDHIDYQVYMGPNLTVVDHLHKMSDSAWFYTQLPWRNKEFKVNPFQKSCVGVKTAHTYTVHLQLKVINYYMLIATLAGFAVFVMAPKLCRNQFFHFTTGISAGILLSLVILTFLLQRKLRVPVFSWIGLFYSLSIYFLTSTWYNLKDYLTEQYYHWVLGYILTAGVVSFAVIYRMGPPSNHRTINLIQWTMQGVSLFCIVASSYHQTASLGLALLLVLWSSIPAYYKAKARTQFRKRFFKVKPKLLSEEEYIAQGNAETARALAELRDYCQSPESKPWKTVTRLHEPSRFAEFIEGSSHITEEEVLEYSHWEVVGTDDEDTNNGRGSLTDDDDDDDDGNHLSDRSFDAQM